MFSKENAQNFLNKLGGTIKISKVFHELKNINDITQQLAKFLIENYSQNQKIIFGLNTYISNNSKISLKNLLKDLKKTLQKENFNARFLNHGPQNIKIPIFFREKLNTNKASELNIIQIKDKIYLSETLATQDIDAYSKRDFDKPFRDPKTGMLPPKLAQIMINLGLENFSAKTIIDPFCGSGTVLMEALLMGKDIIGSDLNEIQVNGALLNVNWLSCKDAPPEHLNKPPEHLNKPPEHLNYQKIFQSDARNFNLDKQITKQSIIVTEGYLGPPRLKLPELFEIQQSNNQLLLLHKNFLQKCQQLNMPKIILNLPAYRCKDAPAEHLNKPAEHLNKPAEHLYNQKYILLKEFSEMIRKIGYEIDPPFSNTFLQKYPFLFLSKRNTLIYDRNDQVIAREILTLRKL